MFACLSLSLSGVSASGDLLSSSFAKRSMASEQPCAADDAFTGDAAAESESSGSLLNCNICLESASEPVITLCGHLYCWPCIYRWIRLQRTYRAVYGYPRCPVCRTRASYTTMIPLYGGYDENPASHLNGIAARLGIRPPPRPSASGTLERLAYNNDYYLKPIRKTNKNNQNQQGIRRGSDGSLYVELLSFSAARRNHYPVLNALKDMILFQFGNLNASFAEIDFDYSISRSERRLRRMEMSLDRVSLFFCCFLVFCLLLF